MDDDEITIDRLTEEDWASHRELRCEMLALAPEAYWTTLGDVEGRSEQQWRASLAGECLTLQARRGSEALGTLGVLPTGYAPDLPVPEDTANIVAVYVRPSARGTGVGRALFAGAAALMREIGRDRMQLEVTHTNRAAIGLYERIGLRPTGHEHPHPRDPSLREVEYAGRLAELTL